LFLGNFNNDVCLQTMIERPIDYSHAARADARDDFESPVCERRADQEFRVKET